MLSLFVSMNLSTATDSDHYIDLLFEKVFGIIFLLDAKVFQK